VQLSASGPLSSRGSFSREFSRRARWAPIGKQSLELNAPTTSQHHIRLDLAGVGSLLGCHGMTVLIPGLKVRYALIVFCQGYFFGSPVDAAPQRSRATANLREC
jgi:hypothetical protein